jgi:thiamine-phosphate pyrophosphorylase
MPGLYAIVDWPHARGLAVAEVTEAVLGTRLTGGDVGADMVQLRAKSATTQERRELLGQMVEPCRRAGARLWVNDDVEARVAGVHGVHLGRDDPGADDIASVRSNARPDADAPQIGLSTHNLTQLREASRQRPDYVAFGPVLPTGSKDNPDPVVGLAGLTDACRLASVPLVAIGGLGPESGARAIEAGAQWVAVIGALLGDTVGEIRERAEVLSLAFARAAQPMSIEAVSEAIPVLPPEQLADLAAWADSLGLHVELGLPARFRPWVDDAGAWYRPSDVLDLQFALGKDPGETWEQWAARAESGEISGGLVQLRVK